MIVKRVGELKLKPSGAAEKGLHVRDREKDRVESLIGSLLKIQTLGSRLTTAAVTL